MIFYQNHNNETRFDILLVQGMIMKFSPVKYPFLITTRACACHPNFPISCHYTHRLKPPIQKQYHPFKIYKLKKQTNKKTIRLTYKSVSKNIENSLSAARPSLAWSVIMFLRAKKGRRDISSKTIHTSISSTIDKHIYSTERLHATT